MLSRFDKRKFLDLVLGSRIIFTLMPSLLSSSDALDFPRGGGSGLTSLEIRDIKIQVEADLEVMHSI